MMNIWNWIDGKKTYVVGFATVLHGLVVVGWQNNDWQTAQLEIELGLGMLGLRHALDKSK